MPPARQGPSGGPHAACICCDKPVARMHGLVVLLRHGKRGVTLRLVTAGYCARHREDAIDAAIEPLRGHGRIVTVSPPELVRPSRHLAWRRATADRLASAGQDLLESWVLLDPASAYPEEPECDVDVGGADEAEDLHAADTWGDDDAGDPALRRLAPRDQPAPGDRRHRGAVRP